MASLDEATNIETDGEYNYYSTIYNYIKSYGSEKTTIVMNPFYYKVTERIMQVSDIVSLQEWT